MQINQYFKKHYFIKFLNLLTMATFHFSHFSLNDNKDPGGQKRGWYSTFDSCVLCMEQLISDFGDLFFRNRHHRPFFLMHFRLSHQWRSLTSWNEIQVV